MFWTSATSPCREQTSGLINRPISGSHPFKGDKPPLRHAHRQTLLGFFYVMRSGTPILHKVAPGYGRTAGHAGRPPSW